jgi:hypothetical protein
MFCLSYGTMAGELITVECGWAIAAGLAIFGELTGKG